MPMASEHGRVHICLEAGATHTGPVSATRLINAVGRTKAKFDSWKWQTIWVNNLIGQDYAITYMDARGEQTESIIDILSRREMSPSDWSVIFSRIGDWGYECFSTPDTEFTVSLLKALGSSAIKIMGADMTHLKLIRTAAQTGLPVLLDARCSITELEWAVDACYNVGNTDVTIVHCPAGYPASAENVNLKAIPLLSSAFPLCQIGFSDHSPGYDMCVAAVALGASYIEKTVTLDRNQPGPEHIMSLIPAEVDGFVKAIREVEKACPLGDGRLPTAVNALHRRSIFLARDIEMGEERPIEGADLEYKRPGNINGIGAEHYQEVIGKWSTKDLKKGSLLQQEDVEEGDAE